ncbi:MAG: SagB family peptide dehydrogenase [Dokdonella sp.]
MYACLKDLPNPADAERFVHLLNVPDRSVIDAMLASLKGEGVPVGAPADLDVGPSLEARSTIISGLASNGFLQFKSARETAALLLSPSCADFDGIEQPDLQAALWKVSRFFYLHQYNGEMVLRNPKALCYLTIKDPAVLALLFQFNQPIDRTALEFPSNLVQQAQSIFAMLAKAQAILPCDEDGRTVEDTDPAQRQWDFHDLLFHSSSRIGRSEKPIGGTFRFKGILPPQPAVKPNPWNGEAIALAVPDMQALFHRDMPLTAALETRCSTRAHSLMPLTLEQLGELLYRTLRNRHCYGNDYGEFTSRPHPSGGANYEDEIYVTISACVGIRRGVYYYDPQNHALCRVTEPCADMDAMLDEAWLATAMMCRPQILLTIASRFSRFNWKYTGMSYAAQLKNVGVIYQTLYLVATAMNIGACGLGTGNADRFARLTGLPYLEEGSVGEFMLGRPLYSAGATGR